MGQSWAVFTLLDKDADHVLSSGLLLGEADGRREVLDGSI